MSIAVPLRNAAPARGGDDRLHVAMVAPAYFEVPPDGYGGVEAVVADLVDALVGRGHRVTLIGAGRHHTRAQQFVATYDDPPTARLGEPLPEVVHAAEAGRILESLDVDVIHDHTLAGPLLARGRLTPTVVTVHGPASGEPGQYYQALADTVGLVAISDAQRCRAAQLPWLATVHNGLRVDTYPFRARKESFTLFLGRFHPRQSAPPGHRRGPGRGAAHRSRRQVRRARRAALLHRAGRPSPRKRHHPLRRRGRCRQARDLLARAACLVFPICWDEPFGLVMIEAMACGTPVVALRRGSASELLIDDRTGILVDDPADLGAAINRARLLDPSACRQHVSSCFTPSAMAAGYEAAYHRALVAGPRGRGTPDVPEHATRRPLLLTSARCWHLWDGSLFAGARSGVHAPFVRPWRPRRQPRATRLIDPLRTSPTANTLARLVSRNSRGGSVPLAMVASDPVRTKPRPLSSS